MKHPHAVVAAALAVACWAGPARAESFKIDVDLRESAEAKPVKLEVPKGAEKASERYFRFAEKTHPVLLSHGYAALSGQQKAAESEDPMDDLEIGAVSLDAIQKLDKDVEYVVRTNNGRNSFVLMVVNRKKENLKAEIALKRGKMYEPVYRRVYSEDGGKTWTTAAWQPPQAEDLYPWTLDVPANTVQTVTIITK